MANDTKHSDLCTTSCEAEVEYLDSIQRDEEKKGRLTSALELSILTARAQWTIAAQLGMLNEQLSSLICHQCVEGLDHPHLKTDFFPTRNT